MGRFVADQYTPGTMAVHINWQMLLFREDEALGQNLLAYKTEGGFVCLFVCFCGFFFVYFPIGYFLQLWSTLQWTDSTQISSHGLLHKNSCHAAQAISSSASGTGTVRYTWLPNARYCSRLRLCVEPFPWQQEQRHTPKVFAQQMRKASLTTNNYTTC